MKIMAENKKSFIAYADWIETFDELTDQEAGKLVKHILKYVNDLNPKSDSKLINLLFIPIKQSLKRDLIKYVKYSEKQRVNGKKGGRPPKPKKTQITQAFISEPKKADSVSVSVSDSVNDINKNIYTKIDNLVLYESEYEKLNKNYTVKEISNILDVIKNRTDNKKRKSLYLTANNWLKNNEEREKEKSSGKKENLTATQKLDKALGL